MLKPGFVLKFVVMEKDIHQNVMTEITSMVMDAVKIVTSKLDFHAMEVPQLQEIAALQFFHQLFPYNQEDKLDFMEKLY